MYEQQDTGINLEFLKIKIDQKINRILGRLEFRHNFGSYNKNTQTQFNLTFKQEIETDTSHQKPLIERQPQLIIPQFPQTTRHKNQKYQRFGKNYTQRETSNNKSLINKTFYTDTLTQQNASTENVSVKKGIRHQQSNPVFQQTLKARKSIKQVSKKFIIKRDSLKNQLIQKVSSEINALKLKDRQQNNDSYKIRQKLVQRVEKNKTQTKKK